MSEETMVFQDPGAYTFVSTNPDLFRTEWPDNFSALFGTALPLMDGAEHKKHRQIIGKAFTPNALERCMPAVTKSLEQSVAKLEAALGQHHDGGNRQAMLRVSKDFFIEASWDFLIADLSASAKQRLTEHLRKIAIGLGVPASELYPPFSEAMQARTALLAELRAIAQERKKNALAEANAPHDALSVLLSAQADDGSHLTLDEVASELIFLMFAAYDTTGTVATSFLSEATARPEVLEELTREQDEVASNAGSEPLSLQIRRMPQMEAVLNEVLRFHPPTIGIFRRCVQDTSYQGYRIPKGQKVWAGIVLANRGEEVAGGADGGAFCPFRFLTNRKARAPSLLTFSSGAHFCLGSQLARRMLMIYLSALIRTFDLAAVPSQSLIAEVLPSAEPEGLQLSLSPRQKQA